MTEKTFEPNYFHGQQYNPSPESSGIHEHAWGNAQYVVDEPNSMLQIKEECAYGCGATRTTDVQDIHQGGPRCS